MRAIIAILLIAGLYMLFAHMDPIPLNHEAIGLGTMHNTHSVIGIVLLVGAIALWFWDRRRRAAPRVG
jgi:hypothetical protein